MDTDGAAELAADTGLRLDDVWREAERWFVTMTKRLSSDDQATFVR